MNFIQQPSGVNFAGNICDIIIESVNDQGFGLSIQGGGSILKEEYRPVNGRITVPLRDIMQRVAVTASITPGVVELPTYQYQFGEAASQTFTCLNGGVEADVDAVGFFENNWLTWQQQIRRTTFHAPQRLCYAVLDEPSAYKVKVRGYFADNSNSEITLCTLTKRGIHTLDMTYGAISGKFQQQIVAFDVWIEVRAGVNSYTQRYILVDEIYSADYFMWVNSLGGVDTAIFTGELREDNKYQTNSAIIDGSESEYNTKVRKAFTKYTGYLGSDNERLWILDFFNSTKRWHLDDGILRQITVSSPKLEHTRGELMGYEFTFSHSKQSKYLNITRIEVPELLEIVDPSGELFFLAPRLIQFKSADVSSAEILFPVQYPHSKEWLQISLTKIIQQAVSAGSGSGQVSSHATSHAKGGSDPVIPFAIGAADINGSSDEDFAAKDITVKSMRTPGAREGLISGEGAIIKTLENGDTVMEADYINVRKGIKASKLTISEVEIEGGITMTGAAKMQTNKVVDLTVKPTDDPQYRANTLRLYFDNQDGKINNHFRVGDQALTKSVNINNEDFQIIHSWRVVKEVRADYIDVYKFNVNTFEKDDLDSPGTTITVNREVDSGSGIPREGDVVVACGSISDENRRAYMIVQTIGINAPIGEEWSYVSDFRPSAAFNLSKYSDAKQTIHQGDSFLWRTRKGIAPLLLPPEVWVEGTIASYPESYIIDGSTFVCMGRDITETPSESNDNWLKTSGKGDTGSKGDYLVQGYCWAEDKPARPVGSSPEGWSAGSDRGVAIVDGDSANDSTGAGYLLTDESGAVLSEPYPANCRLWGSTATFDGATGEVVGEWSDPYQVSGEDGKDGQDGKDAPKLKVQFSVDGSTKWHDVYVAADRYRRESNDDGATWGAALRMWGETGSTGADGKKTPYTDFSYGYGLSRPTTWSDAPPTKVAGQHLWERIQKYTPKEDNSGWTLASTSYAIISEYVEVGGVNLALNSGRVIENAEYLTRNYALSGNLIAGNVYTLSFYGTLGVGKDSFDILMGGGYTWIGKASEITAGYYKLTFTCPATIGGDGSFRRLLVHAAPRTASATSKISKLKLERGNRATDWSPAPEDVQGEIDAKSNASRVDAIYAFFKGSIPKDQIEAILNEENNAPFEVDTSDPDRPFVKMTNAFIRNLVSERAFIENVEVTKLKTTPQKISPTDLNTHDIEISGNQMLINTTNAAGQKSTNVTIKGGAIPAIDQFNAAGSSDTKLINRLLEFKTDGATPNISSLTFPNLENGTTLNIRTTLHTYAQYGNIILGQMPGIAWAKLYLVQNGDLSTKLLIAEANGSKTVEVNVSRTVGAGSYALRLELYASQDGGNWTGDAKTTEPIVFSYNYLDSSNMQAFIGDNGFAFQGNKDNYVHISFLNKMMSMVVKGNFDAPFIAQAGYVMSATALQSYYGSKQRTLPTQIKAEKVSLGRYRYYHTINHKEYTPTVILEPTSSSWIGSYTLMAVTNTSFEIYVRNSAGQLDDCGMRVTVFGRN